MLWTRCFGRRLIDRAMNVAGSNDINDWVIHYSLPGSVQRPALFLDRDGTIIENVPYLNDPEKVVLIKGVAERINEFKNSGFAIVVVTNQSGVARGVCSADQYRAVEMRMQQLLGLQCVDAVYACPFLPGGEGGYNLDHCWRKPSDGMLRTAAQDLNLDLSRSLMVGDSLSDIAAGARAGVSLLVHLLSGHGMEEREEVVRNFAKRSSRVSGSALLLLDTLADLNISHLSAGR